jgi:2-polyprenyl-3-methyl-5-hydroxy-6-metoxy-1,4-benzoquinol methylase
VLAQFLGDVAGRTILDVGTGTGRAAIALARRGAIVTGVDASDEMLRIARERTKSTGLAVEFHTGDAHDLAFSDGSFDIVVCLRVLMHAPGWRRCIGELCRVSSRLVLFDYPGVLSVAAVQSGVRRLAARLGAQTEAYRVFADRTITRELSTHAFMPRARHRQFVLPIALHKAVGSRRFTITAERWLGRAGLLALAGSPVTVVAERLQQSAVSNGPR